MTENTTFDWLKRSGLAQLSMDEINAITDFTFLWSLFEGRLLSESCSVAKLLSLVDSIEARAAVRHDAFDAASSHFRQRYFDGENFTVAFEGLHLRRNDRQDVVESFLRNSPENKATTLKGLLIIIYRLRNNLFHGLKWSYGIADQLKNFSHANSVLKGTIELHNANPI